MPNPLPLESRALAHLERLRQSTGLNVSDFARFFLGITPGAYYAWKKDPSRMSNTTALYALRIAAVALTPDECVLRLRHAAKGPRFSGRKPA